MPLFHVKCVDCGAESDVMAPDLAGLSKKACKCSGKLKRKARGITAQVNERLDNGSMPKAIERHANAERLWQERGDKSDELAGGSHWNTDTKDK